LGADHHRGGLLDRFGPCTINRARETGSLAFQD
jgi:hypothetical protein